MNSKKQTEEKPKYIVKQNDQGGLLFWIIHQITDKVYLVERYDDIAWECVLGGYVSDFNPDSNPVMENFYEIKKEDVQESELFYTQYGAIGEACRIMKSDLERLTKIGAQNYNG